MRKILTSFSLVAASLAFAQVGINADENDIAKDAVFHVKNNGSEAKGVILPSVSLTGEQDQTTITAGLSISQVTTGLMVWNDGTAGLSPAGYYYWDGAKWVLTGNVGGDSVNSADVKYKINFVGTVEPTSFDNYDAVVFTSGGGNKVPNPANYSGKSIILINNSTVNVTLEIDGGADIIPSTGIRRNTSLVLVSDGSNWYRLSS